MNKGSHVSVLDLLSEQEVSWRYKTPAVHIWSGALVWFSGVERDGQGGSKQGGKDCENVKVQGLVKGESENVCGKVRG